MSIQELIQSISERVQTTASVKAVYGEPITAEGKTIIPGGQSPLRLWRWRWRWDPGSKTRL